MNKKSVMKIVALTLGMSGIFGACDTNEPEAQPEVVAEASEQVLTPAELGYGDDWVELDDGVWTRIDDDGHQTVLGSFDASESEEDGETAVLSRLRAYLVDDVPEEPVSGVCIKVCCWHWRCYVEK